MKAPTTWGCGTGTYTVVSTGLVAVLSILACTIEPLLCHKVAMQLPKLVVSALDSGWREKLLHIGTYTNAVGAPLFVN